MIRAEQALPGRNDEMPVAESHYVTGNAIKGPATEGMEIALFGLGCFWGAERIFWQLDGVWSTSVGYAGGFTPNPSYEEVCSGMTGHNEVVKVLFNKNRLEYSALLKVFWESHNPTQGMGQGNDRGTQYRSGIYCYGNGQYKQALQSREDYQCLLDGAELGAISTEIIQAPDFYFAEDYHQQYLAKNPGGYCGIGGTGVSFNV